MYELNRSTSIRLRKRKEQAKKHFLQDRSNEEFVYDTRHEERTYMSIQDQPMKPTKREKHSNLSINLMTRGPRSLGCIPSKSVSDLPSKYNQQKTGLVNESNDFVKSRGRRTEESRDKKLWRRSTIGLGTEENARRVMENNYGYYDNSQHIKMHREIELKSPKQDRGNRNLPEVTRESQVDWWDNYGQVVRDSSYQPFSLPVTASKAQRNHEQVPLLKGMLWQKKDRIFSRWKQRFFILTTKCLHCYEKCPKNTADISSLIFEVQLSSIEKMNLTEKKGYLTIALAVHKEGKILLRSTVGIREWFHVITRCCKTTLEQTTEQFWSGRQQRESEDVERWLLGRQGGGTLPPHYNSTPTISPYTQAVPSILQRDQNMSQHEIWSYKATEKSNHWGHEDNRQNNLWSLPDTRQYKPKKRSNSQRHLKRPKSFIESSTPWHVESKLTKAKYKAKNNKKTSAVNKSEDSGNSSLSTDT